MGTYDGVPPTNHLVYSAGVGRGKCWFCKNCDRTYRVPDTDKSCPKCYLRKGDVFGGTVDGWTNRWGGNPGERVNDTAWGPAYKFGKGSGKQDQYYSNWSSTRPNGK